jgi:hypothetical protein
MKVSNKLTNLLTIIAVFAAFGAQAQDSSDPESHETVMYDPLFWKQELSLKNTQSRRIEQINSEFYQSIRTMKPDGADAEVNNERLERGLQERSQKIFDTLLPKQKRKLEKIIDKTAPVTAP